MIQVTIKNILSKDPARAYDILSRAVISHSLQLTSARASDKEIRSLYDLLGMYLGALGGLDSVGKRFETLVYHISITGRLRTRSLQSPGLRKSRIALYESHRTGSPSIRSLRTNACLQEQNVGLLFIKSSPIHP